MQLKERSISLDLYRFLCMFLITTTHVTGYSRIIHTVSPEHINFYLILFLYVLQRFSVNGFILISAYYLTGSTNTSKKVISFWLQLLFFSITIFLLACLIHPSVFSVKRLIKSIFPVMSYHYWYPINYIILLIFVPTLNKIVKALSKKDLLHAILALGFFLCCFFHFNPLTDETLFIGNHSHSLIWFIFLYLVAAYFRLHGVAKPVLLGPVTFLITGVLLFLAFFLKQFAIKAGPSYLPVVTFFDKVNLLSYNSLLSLLLSVSSFIMFLRIKIAAPKWLARGICFLIPATFAIYLIQEHSVIRTPLWDFVNINRFAESPWLMAVIVLVFLALWAGAVALYLLYRLCHKLFLHKLEEGLLRLLTRHEKRQ